MPILAEYKTDTFKELANNAFGEFISRIGDDFDEPDYSFISEQLSVCIVEPDQSKIAARLKYAARALAKKCKERDFVALGPLSVPTCIETALSLNHGNVHMRACKAFDVLRGEIVIRLDVLGYLPPADIVIVARCNS